MGVGNEVDNLITRVSLAGVTDFTRGQHLIGAGFKLIGGDAKGAANDFKMLSRTSNAELTGMGLAASAAGAGIMAGLVKGAFGASEMNDNIEQLGFALHKMGNGGQAEAERISASLDKIPKVIPKFRHEMLAAAQSLSWSGLKSDTITQMLPGIVDATVALRHMGKEVDVQQVSFAIYKAITTGQVVGLKRLGFQIDETRFKTDRVGTIIKSFARFQGAAAQESNTLSGALAECKNDMDAMDKSLGASLVPTLKWGAHEAAGFTEGIKHLNEQTHGAVGVTLVAGAALLSVAGATAIFLPGLKAAIDLWQQHKVGAVEATAAEEGAATAASTVGAATKTGAAGMTTLANQTTMATEALQAFTPAAEAAAVAGRMAGGSAIPVGVPTGSIPLPTSAVQAETAVAKTATSTAVQAAENTGIQTLKYKGMEAVGAVGAAEGVKGLLGKAGGLGGKLFDLKGLGTGLMMNFGSDMLRSWAHNEEESGYQKYLKTGSTSGKLEMALGGAIESVGTDALKGAAMGKVVPIVGPILGSVAGALYGVYDGIKGAGAMQDRLNKDIDAGKAGAWAGSSQPDWSPGQGIDTAHAALQAEANEHLKAIVELMKGQTKTTVGGGSKAAKAYNEGDVQRALFSTLHAQVV